MSIVVISNKLPDCSSRPGWLYSKCKTI